MENNEQVENKVNEKLQKLTSEQKKTIWEWTKYLSKALLTAILKKLLGNV